MAETKSTSEYRTPMMSKASREALSNHVRFLLDTHRLRTDFASKMEAIDQAYARYKSGNVEAGNTGCGDIFASDDVTPPIVVAQVDSMVGYLAEVFCSGSPLFPVVSTPANRTWAEQLETLLDDHALLGGYPRQLLLMLRNAVKYNFGPMECEWAPVKQFSVEGDFTNTTTGRKVEATRKYFNKLNALDPYNTVFDPDVPIGDISEKGDYAGYIEMYSYMRLKQLIARYQTQYKVYDAGAALVTGRQSPVTATQYYRQKPDISKLISSYRVAGGNVNWEAWVAGNTKRSMYNNLMGYEVVKMYIRILPSDFQISAPQPNTAQIWMVILVNGQLLVAERVISAYDVLPILFGQPIEDGFGIQTQGVAEGEMEFQDAASKLFNIRFSSARRAVSDRALYVADAINPNDVNSKAAAPKIPVKLTTLANQTLDSVYKQIPFDMRGLETTLQDAQTIVQFSKDLHGQNSPRQGQFQKGNKSVREWNDTMAGSEERLRLPALALEYQFFSPLKSMMTLNIFQFADNVEVISQRTGNVLKIDINELRKQVLSFRLADGYSPKSKLAATDILLQGMQLILGSPVLQQSLGQQLPAIFIHLMSLGGVKGLDEYAQPITSSPPQGPATTGLPSNTLQNPVAP